MDFIRAKVAHDRATQSVNPHEVLLRQHEVEQAQQNLARVQSQQTLTFNVERERALLTIQQLEAQLAATQLVSPLDGNVLALNLTPGREVAAFQPVGLVADLNQLEVVAEQIPPQTILALREGMPAVVTNRIASAEQPGTPGHIRQVPAPSLTALLPDFEEETQNIDNAVRVALDTPAVTAGYQVGDRVRVTVEMERRENVLWLPPQAIRAANNGEYFVVITGQRVPVEIGLQTPGQVEIKQGLTEGQLVDGP
jgi:multidrug efflux pump subunit AcrA (membrane-fusion protein)